MTQNTSAAGLSWPFKSWRSYKALKILFHIKAILFLYLVKNVQYCSEILNVVVALSQCFLGIKLISISQLEPWSSGATPCFSNEHHYENSAVALTIGRYDPKQKGPALQNVHKMSVTDLHNEYIMSRTTLLTIHNLNVKDVHCV